MFCENCGKEIDDHVKFCNYCGYPVGGNQNAPAGSPNVMVNPASVMPQNNNAPVRKKKPKVWLWILLAVIAAAAACFMIFLRPRLFPKYRADLSKMMDISVSGVDGKGKLSCTLKLDDVEEDYAKRMNLREDDAKTDARKEQLEKALENGVKLSSSKEDSLSNGDKIEITAKIDSSAFTKLDAGFTFSKIDYKVSGLTEVKQMTDEDIFDGVNVTFSGTAPMANAALEVNNEYIDSSCYTMDKSDNLALGDMVTVTCTAKNRESGDKPYDIDKNASCEKTFTVSGVESYITSIKDIPKDTLDALNKKADELAEKYLIEKEELNSPESEDYSAAISSLNVISDVKPRYYYVVSARNGEAQADNIKDAFMIEYTFSVDGQGEYALGFYLHDLKMDKDGKMSPDVASGMVQNPVYYSSPEAADKSYNEVIGNAYKIEKTDAGFESAVAGKQSASSDTGAGKFTVVTASSVLPAADGNTYVPENATDGNRQTAWVEGIDGDGIGEWIQLSTPDGSEYFISSITISPGYQKSDDIRTRNGEPTKVKMEIADGSYMDITLDPTKPDTTVTFNAVKTSSVKLTIEEVKPGTKYSDTAITEVSVN